MEETLGSVKRIEEMKLGMNEIFLQIETDFLDKMINSFLYPTLDAIGY
jgi:hypothetical protein